MTSGSGPQPPLAPLSNDPTKLHGTTMNKYSMGGDMHPNELLPSSKNL